MSDKFPAKSRYSNVDETVFQAADGTRIVHLKRRFLPQPERFETLTEHKVVAGDRLDNVTANYLGDPEQFWRIADANNAMRPEELTEEPGRTIRITLPEGLTGSR